MLFDKKELPFPLLSYLLHTALQNRGPGGSLGSTYFQIKEFLSHNVYSGWCIVEQMHYVKCGRELFEDKMLRFFYSIEECIASNPIDLAIFSGVVQFLPKPHNFLSTLASHGFKTIIFDRTAFIKDSEDRLTAQKVWPSVYEASYPAWFFNEIGFLRHFEKDYSIKGEFCSYVEGESIIEINHEPIGYMKGFYLVKK